MEKSKLDPKIKITKGGPYIVSGKVPLSEKIITPKGRGYIYKNGRDLPQSESYTLCRCGKSKKHPFCDGTHVNDSFLGEETASRDTFEERAELLEGITLDLLYDNRCAYARFCHRNHGDVWKLTENAYQDWDRLEAIQAANECPAGRLVAMDKKGVPFEPAYGPSIEILQDIEEKVSGPIFVKGYIPIESSDGYTYEIRNRVTLCRCGNSKNMPFCDATHVSVKFSDKK